MIEATAQLSVALADPIATLVAWHKVVGPASAFTITFAGHEIVGHVSVTVTD